MKKRFFKKIIAQTPEDLRLIAALCSDSLTVSNKIKYLNLPKGTSSLFCLFDLFLQKLGFYNKYVHILGELGQNIECSSEKYRQEFKDHIWNDIVDSIDEELKEAEKIYNS